MDAGTKVGPLILDNSELIVVGALISLGITSMLAQLSFELRQKGKDKNK